MSRAEVTHRRILDATRRLLEGDPGAPVSMRAIADAAGVSRQLLYLHFDNRGQLLLEVSRDVDAAARPLQWQARVDSAPNARSALREAVKLQGHIKPLIHGVAKAVDRLRVTDTDAARVWHEREQARLDRCAAIIRRLQRDRVLQPGWTVAPAAQQMWSTTSLRAWEELVIEQGWSTRAWVRRTTRLLESTLVVPE